MKQPQLRLFTLLKQKKIQNLQTQNIEGIPMIESDCSDTQELEEKQLEIIKKKVKQYKLEKANQIVSLCNATNQSVDDIVSSMKEQIHRHVRGIILSQAIRNSNEKSIKQGGSTLPGSQNRKNQTPGQISAKGKTNKCATNIKQFTLGQCEHESTNRSAKEPSHSQFVSEFKVVNKESVSRKIKDKIMNSGKGHK